MRSAVDSRFAFDPQLPTLSLLFNPEAVARLFQEQWPEVGTTTQPPVTVRACRRQATQYQPSRYCLVTYELTVERPGTLPWQTIGVVKSTPLGLQHRLFDADPQLPWLAAAVNRNEMGRRFATLLANGQPWDAESTDTVELCAITPIRYKPGTRCAFQYHLRTSSGLQVFFGKLLARDGDWLIAIIRALYQASQAIPAMPRIAQPLAYWPGVHMLVQSAVTGRAELNLRAFDSSEDGTLRQQWLYDAGVHLATLHTFTGAGGPKQTLEADLHELSKYKAAVARVSPLLATKFEMVIDEITAQARDRVEPAPVASHGAFRTDQLMIENGRLVLIDLDSFCWANRARDIGNFLAYLSWKAIRLAASGCQPEAAFIERARRAFLDGYERVGPAPDMTWLALYWATSMLKIAGRRFRSLNYSEWPLVPQLLNSASAILQTPLPQ